MRTVLCLIILLVINLSSFAQVKLIGFITNKSNQKIPNAIIIFDNNQTTYSNSNGIFKLKTTKGTHIITISHPNYFTLTTKLTIKHDTNITFMLKPLTVQIKQVVIQAHPIQPTSDEISINMKLFNKIPALSGESDAIKFLQILPGIQMGQEGTTGINVRGGDNSQNLFLIDGVSLLKPSHIFNFLSTINPFVIKNVDFYKGGFPGYFGNHLSSVINITLKKPDLDSSFAKADIGLLQTNLFYNLKLSKNNAVILTGRTTYIDKIANGILWAGEKLFLRDFLNKPLPVFQSNFYDVYIKDFQHINSINSDLNLLFYSSKDIYGLGKKTLLSRTSWISQEDFITWGTDFISLRFKHTIKSKNLTFKTQLYLQSHFNEFGSINIDSTQKHYGIGIFQYKIFNFNLFLNKKSLHNRIIFALNFTKNFFRTLDLEYYFGPPQNDTLISSPVNIISPSITDFWNIGNFHFMFASRLNLYKLKNSYRYIICPRFSLSYSFNNKSYIRLSYDRTTQPFFKLYNYSGSLPLDITLLVSNLSQLSKAQQLSAEFTLNPSHSTHYSISLYYKKMTNLADLKLYGDQAFFLPNNIEYYGKGWSYGSELFFQKNFKKLAVQSSLTLSRAFRQFKYINSGKPYPYKFDRPINFNILLNYKLNSKINLSLFWTYMSGFNITVPVAQFWIPYDFENPNQWGYCVYFNSRNNYRTPPYTRLDLMVNYVKIKRKCKLRWSFGLYNALNHFNVYNAYVISNSWNFPRFHKSFIKFIQYYPIIPVISLRIDWF